LTCRPFSVLQEMQFWEDEMNPKDHSDSVGYVPCNWNWTVKKQFQEKFKLRDLEFKMPKMTI
jgi:hypothetical protein